MYFFKILLLPTLSCTLFMGDGNSFAFQLQFRLSRQVLEVQGHCCIMFWGKKTGPFSEVLFKEWLVVVVLLIPSLLCLSEHSLFSQLSGLGCALKDTDQGSVQLRLFPASFGPSACKGALQYERSLEKLTIRPAPTPPLQDNSLAWDLWEDKKVLLVSTGENSHCSSPWNTGRGALSYGILDTCM